MTDAKQSELLAAIEAGDRDEVVRIVDEGFELNLPSDEGASPLFAAALSGDLEIVRHLLQRGANPNFTAQEPGATKYCVRVLDLAMQARFLLDWDRFQPIVELLVERGAVDSRGNAQAHAKPELRARALQHQNGS